MNQIKRVKDYIDECSQDIGNTFYSWVTANIDDYEKEQGIKIESPVEQLFYIAWYKRKFLAHTREGLLFLLEPQYESKKITGIYRIDFLVDCVGFVINYEDCFSEKAIFTVPSPNIGVEIDGHVWHEKTKEQAQYHKERERFLISKGWKLYRYTGAEVYKNPDACLDDLEEKSREDILNWRKELRLFDKEK